MGLVSIDKITKVLSDSLSLTSTPTLSGAKKTPCTALLYNPRYMCLYIYHGPRELERSSTGARYVAFAMTQHMYAYVAVWSPPAAPPSRAQGHAIITLARSVDTRVALQPYSPAELPTSCDACSRTTWPCCSPQG